MGCPEHSQVGPLPWLSKSRRSGIWSAFRTPRSLLTVCWATRMCPRPVGSAPILRRLLRRHYLYMQLLQLRRIDGARRAQHQVLVALRLRKRDHVTDVVGAEDGHHQAIDAGRDAAMWRHSILERVEQMAELRVDLFTAHAQDLEDALLELALMDADAAAGNLNAVQHAVVRARTHVVGPRREQVHVLGPRRRKRMVAVS